MSLLLAALGAVLLWWFATGLLIYLDGLPRRTFPWTLAGATLLASGGLWALAWSGARTDATGAAVAFVGAFLVWAWQEASFYTGYVTGPRTRRCPDDCRGLRHLGHAVEASLYHEVALLLSAGAVWWVLRGAENRLGLWVFLLLLAAHQSARLNVVLGVRNLAEAFLPDHLEHLGGFLRRRESLNPLFPFSVTLATGAAVYFALGAWAAGTEFAATSSVLLATTATLAAVEHWLLVIPVPAAERLWEWALASRGPAEGAGGGAAAVGEPSPPRPGAPPSRPHPRGAQG